ncbi:hypothetical protein L6164_014012 [Bauhinia variegata]|uniref:Uncharacterized protein n=1 Tax=Bauhinia variegata TaxID=167791 RepID=A0ACB9NKT8_BAUVA|nr:hypothetical protein L6164_014012 [Bauhinia variegata]
MRDSDKKLNHRGSRKVGHLDQQTERKRRLSLKFKKGSTKSQGKKLKLKLKSSKDRVGASLSRRTVTDSSNKGLSKESSNKKIVIRRNQHKSTEGKLLQKPSSSKLQGKNVSVSTENEAKDGNGEVKNQKLKRRRKKKRQRDNTELDEASRLQRRTRYLLIKMKLEQNLIDAYSGEGWKGQSREKIRPEKELQRAQKQILKCKLSIRDAIHQLDSLSSVGSIEDSVIAPDGSVYHEHIFCAKCKLREAFPDNDIILCDGTCNRAFHQKCLDPPLDTKNIPPEDEGWFCKFCECKMDILEVVNAHLGTHFSMDCNWQDVFKEEAAFPDGDTALLNPEEEWPSDDSEDDDYNPEKREDNHSISTEDTDDVASDDLSNSPCSWSLEGDFSVGKEATGHEAVNSCIDSDESGEIACGRRQRKAVDYKKLYDEMFGKDAPPCEQVSEDEDWGPARRKRREKESDAVNTLMTLHECENKHPNTESEDIIEEVPSGMQIKRPCFRIPHDAVKKLRQAFAENELPSRSVKESLSKELGLDAEKVSKWFKNARYLALKTRKHAEVAEQPQSFMSRTSKDSRLQKLDSAEILTSNEASKITLTDLKDVSRGKQMKSSGYPLTKRKRNKSPPQSTENGDKDLMEFSDDVSLKKLLKARKRKLNFMLEGGSKAAEKEFERLSHAKIKLDSMKQKLIAIQNRGKGSNEPHLKEPTVIYVPVAELREKV